jgi:tRNA (mo5U34)-methyltransferase
MNTQEELDALAPWHYGFTFDGTAVQPKNPVQSMRHAKRRSYFFDPVAPLLAGKRVLDLGSNAGYWSLAALEAGASHATGIEARGRHVEQANLVFRLKGIPSDRYDFQVGDVFDISERADVVLCLGLLYHVARPVELMEGIADTGAALVVLDTRLSRHPGAAFEVRWDDTEQPENAVGQEMVMFPTREAVFALGRIAGYRVYCLRPSIAGAGVRDYQFGYRRAFVLSRGVEVPTLSTEPRHQPVRDLVGRLARPLVPAHI